MSFEVASIDIWVAEVRNRPGELAHVLESLRDAGAQLEFIVARQHERGSSVIFVAPLTDDAQRSAAQRIGMHKSQSMYAVRVAGQDQPGLAARISRALADGKINIRGMTAASLDPRSALYVRLETSDAARRALELLRRELSTA